MTVRSNCTFETIGCGKMLIDTEAADETVAAVLRFAKDAGVFDLQVRSGGVLGASCFLGCDSVPKHPYSSSCSRPVLFVVSVADVRFAFNLKPQEHGYATEA